MGETDEMAKTIYKIVPASLWQNAKDAGIFEGAAIDLSPLVSHRFAADEVMQAFETAGQPDRAAKVLVQYAAD